MLKVLVTGAKGFIGRNLALEFFKNNFCVLGIGHGKWDYEEYIIWGLSKWVNDDITIEAIRNLNVDFDLIIHCAGSGSVKDSIINPYLDFQKTPLGTIEVLEYIRLYNPKCKLIYPSSPAVVASTTDFKIREESFGMPVSPYGFNKKIAEDLCLSYHRNYGLCIGIVRLFSVYGNGLKKQLLWDACNRIVGNEKKLFKGTGKESRDFIHISDAAMLIVRFNSLLKGFSIINCGSGKLSTVKEVVQKLAQLLEVDDPIKFNGKIDKGNPLNYYADISKACNLFNWTPKVDIDDGLKQYVDFFTKKTIK